MNNSVVPNYENIKKYAPHLLKDLKKNNIVPETEIDMIDYIIDNKPTVSVVRKFLHDHVEIMKDRYEQTRREKISRSFTAKK
jgi:hypothetical protein